MIDNYAIDKRQVRLSFERAAAGYDAAAVMQHEVCRRLGERLECMKLDPGLILDAGCGTGYGSEQLLRRYPRAGLVALDMAHAMLRAASKRLPAQRRWAPWLSPRRVNYLCADMEQLPVAENSVDLVWSNLALQWSNDLDTVFGGMRRVLRPDGLLMFTTFGPDTLKELRQVFSQLDGYPHVSRFIDMHDVGDALMRGGFVNPVMEMETLTLTYDVMLDLMRDLKAIGAHNAAAGRRRGLMGKTEWQRLREAYETFRSQGRLPATYEVIYGHAWKGTPKPAKYPAGEQAIQWRGRP